jgi:ribonuclease BN (tRNA processing enzyme)
MNHPSPTLGYRVEADGVSVCYLSDHEPYAERVWREGAEPGRMDSILHDGDREHAEYMRGVDVLVHEAQYTPEEYPAKRNWGHSTFEYVVQLAALAGVRRLYLTHHDPSHDDAFMTALEQRARRFAEQIGSKIEVHCAYEGCEIEV